MRDPVILRAAEIVAGRKVGALSVLAEKLGVSQAAVSQWRRVPPNRVVEIERLTGGKIKRHEIRPDVFPAEDEAA